jgi:RNA polymerase sigma-B factor
VFEVFDQGSYAATGRPQRLCGADPGRLQEATDPAEDASLSRRQLGDGDHAGKGAEAHNDELLRVYAETHDLALRNRLVLRHARLARYLAARFATSGGNEPEDLLQVAYLGLISAIERYDPNCQCSFASYARPTIVGYIKHHLRDTGWLVKAPRRMRELAGKLPRLKKDLEVRFGRAPTVAELAGAAGVDEERLLAAMEVHELYRPGSLDSPTQATDEGGGTMLWEVLGGPDARLSGIEDAEWVKHALSLLDERESAILQLRFFCDCSQHEAAGHLGISQMHVSRLERRAIGRLKKLLSRR